MSLLDLLHTIASTDEIIINDAFETGSLEDKEIFICLSDKIISQEKINKFLESIERHPISEKKFIDTRYRCSTL
jgi:hypothetical protein